MGVEPECPVCGSVRAEVKRDLMRRTTMADCGICGLVDITDQARDRLASGEVPAWRVSAALRRRSDLEPRAMITVGAEDLESLCAEVRPPRPMDAIDRVLLMLHDQVERPPDYGQLPGATYARLVLRDQSELDFLLGKAVDLGFLEAQNQGRFRLSLHGWERVADLTAQRPIGSNAFAAMSFADELRSAWYEGIAPALEGAGYTPVRMDEVDHNDRIDDRIIAEIRRSSLLVADFTGHRGGVYFEAGLAMGLGIPVIFTCRADAMEGAHFDTRQYNHVVWGTPEELRERLLARVLATAPAAVDL